jgi:hydroxymethylpyrimidine kinase/phosphomethylpyrimidine kinase
VTPPRCLSIATSDSGGGAGIQADLKAFSAAGCYGMTVIVGVTAQNTKAILATHVLPVGIITAQLEAVYDDIGVDAAKTGALLSAEVIEAVADFLGRHPTPLVVDPVLRASTGSELLDPEAVEALVG